MKRWFSLPLILGVAACGDVGCGASTPSATDQAAVATYGASLQSCIAQVKLLDGGWAFYDSCAAKVDSTFGLAPKDGGQ